MSGYSQSKWAAEALLLRARDERGLRTNIVRVGQLAGDSKTGAWSETEWMPVLLRGSQVMGALPDRKEVRPPICINGTASDQVEPHLTRSLLTGFIMASCRHRRFCLARYARRLKICPPPRSSMSCYLVARILHCLRPSSHTHRSLPRVVIPTQGCSIECRNEHGCRRGKSRSPPH